MLPTLVIAGTAFAPPYGPLTIVAADGGAEAGQGLASGWPHTATRFARRPGSPR